MSTWVLALSVTLYLAFTGGGYDIESHAQVGIAVWWIVTVCAAWSLLPAARITSSSLVPVGFFAAFVVWTAVGISWSISSGRSFQDLALVSCYLGILVLALLIHRDREDAIRHTTAAVATGIAIVAALALVARLYPDSFPASREASQLLGSNQARLAWPLNYWNALAALMAVGLPLLLSLLTAARRLAIQAAAAAAVPVVALCAALTLSRGGLIEGAVAAIVFIAFTKERALKLLACLVPAAGSAVLIAAAFSRHALQHGVVDEAARHEGRTLLVAIVLVCIGVGIAHIGVGLVVRHAKLPGFISPSVRTARIVCAAAIAALIIIALATHLPHRLDTQWRNFKNPNTTASFSNTGRFNSASGEGRYQYWVAAVDSAKSHPLTGSGAGTFQLDWLPRASIGSYVENAHSLYVETYAELGVIGLLILLGFFISSLILLVRQVIRSEYEARTRAAAVTAAVAAFMVGAAFDWLWQMAVIPAVLMLLIAASLAPESLETSGAESSSTYHPGIAVKLVAVGAGLLCLVATGYPLTTSNAITRSQNSARVGDTAAAVANARDAVRLESGSAAAQLQLALSLELTKNYPAAVKAAKRATNNEPQGWENWLVLSRLYAEEGNAKSAASAYAEAKKMNPKSSLFTS